jgi:uncharacterized protein
MTSPLRTALRSRLKAAMRAGDRQTAGAMRSVLAALENAEAVPGTSQATSLTQSEHVAGAALGLGAAEAPRRVLFAADERALVEREVAELRQSAALFAEAGKDERRLELLEVAAAVEAVLEG